MTLQTAKIDRDKFIYFVSKHLLRRNRFGAFRNGVPCNCAPVAWPQPTPKNYDNHMPQPHLGSSLVKDIVAQISRSKIDFLLNYIGSYSQYLSQLLAWRKPNEHVFKLMSFNMGWGPSSFPNTSGALEHCVFITKICRVSTWCSYFVTICTLSFNVCLAKIVSPLIL